MKTKLILSVYCLAIVALLQQISSRPASAQLSGIGQQAPNIGNIYSKAICDNSTDNTNQIASEISLLNGANGGTLIFAAGTCITGPQTVNNNIIFKGAGKDISVLKLKTGSNADFFKGSQTGYGGGVVVNIAAAGQTGSNTGNLGWGFQDITLDGNYTNQSGTSACLKVYGYNYIILNVGFQFCLNEGMYLDYNPASAPSSFAYDFITNVETHENHGVGTKLAGPTDIKIANLMTHNNTLHGLQVGPNAGAMIVTQMHSWGPGSPASGFVGSALAILIESGYFNCVNCSAEGSNLANVAWMGTGGAWTGGHNFGISGTPSLQVACFAFGQQAGLTPYTGQTNQGAGVTTAASLNNINIHTQLDTCNPAIAFNNYGANNVVDAIVTQVNGSVYFTGNYGAGTNTTNIQASGLSNTGADGTGSIIRLPANTFDGFELINGGQSNVMFDCNTTSNPGACYYFQGTPLSFYSDAGGTLQAKIFGSTGMIQTNGAIQATGTFPTITGCGTISATSGGATAGKFTTSLTGTCTAVIPLPTASNGWACYLQDITKHVAANILVQSASAAASCTVTGTTAASDVLTFIAEAY